MRVGGRHKWYYEKGEWNEKKVTPDCWEFSYAVPKRRAGHAPPGSGVPVGTEYHWYILAHQNVRKLDKNTYSTAMTGLKYYKLAHKRAGRDTWSTSEPAQRQHLVKILKEILDDLSRGSQLVEPADTPAVAKLRQGVETKTRQRTAAARRATRKGGPTRRRLVASAGRR
jgi:hypothetical protein